MSDHANGSGGGDLLIVDDAPENLDILVEILKETGCNLRPATSGRAALDASLKKPPDLVLLDVNMPGMDGFTLCEKMRADERLKSVPVIFVSGSTDREEIRRAFAAGGVDYIVKPFQGEEVIARVSAHLELRRLRAELARYRGRFGPLPG